MQQELEETALRLAEELRARGLRIVFAESCTAGLLSATLSRIPGISEFLCGSAVTYRNGTKSAWLDVSASDLGDPEIGPVSRTVAEQMCRGVLATTPEADVAASITGHLGPDAPPELDGIAYVAVLLREEDDPTVQRISLPIDPAEPFTLRHTRQLSAAIAVYHAILNKIIPAQ
jgi:nicotinamide-nucleotide amidase